MHYVLDLWFERHFRKTCQRWAALARFADDFVAAFRNEGDAKRFRQEVEERLAAFGLAVAPAKTRLLRFDANLLRGAGRPAERPESFTFFGFTHFVHRTHAGKTNIGRIQGNAHM